MSVSSALLPRALLPVVLLATLILAPGGLAAEAEAIGAEQVIDLVNAAKHITFGHPQPVTLTIDGRSVVCTVSLDSLGNITAVPVVADKAVKQISISVTTINSGVVPNAVTVITGDGQVLGFTVTRGPDGGVAGLVAGAPVTAPPLRNELAELTATGGTPDPGGHHHDADGTPPIHHGPPSDLVDEKPPLPPGTPSPGGGLPYAPGTSPFSQNVSPH
jgi:hypothetical protein